MAKKAILAIDQGTTSSRAMVFDAAGTPMARAQQELKQHYPDEGWVEHDPEDIWSDTIAAANEALARAMLEPADLAAIGITNQRETTIVWERSTGRPIHNAIVWQDRRTAAACERLLKEGNGPTVQAKTGLLIDSYFSATKIAWILDQVPGARARAERGELAFGTVDSFLLWRLTAGKRHATDATNAARTMLFDIHTASWDDELLRLFGIPRALLPEVLDNAADFGVTDASLFGAAVPIAGMAGDQQAATVGQTCLAPGEVKSTYGTGCFMLLNTGTRAVPSKNRLLTTIAYRIGGRSTYALEGSIFAAGSTIQWLRDGLRLLANAGESEALARARPGTGNVYLVPAFTGLGAPYWDPHARGAILGLTRDAGIADIVRSALEAVCYQTRDLLGAMIADSGQAPVALRVDGGMTVNDWTMQRLADLIGVPVERPVVTETTALGAAYLAGLQTGLFGSLEALPQLWARDRRFDPEMPEAERDRRYQGWTDAVRRIRTTA
ncbi:MAG: glycerol kinase GlpK [Proteobacteria bacterium]|nr:glycerol kinase GlpK [Pseudomonadota bacterium]MBI3499121.1 glycerol kinase GlpK [Pseudomonadota bacterium]